MSFLILLTFSYNGMVRIALFNCAKDQELCKRYGVKKFPTFLAFESSKLIGSYEDEPSLDGFLRAISEFLAHSTLKGSGYNNLFNYSWNSICDTLRLVYEIL